MPQYFLWREAVALTTLPRKTGGPPRCSGRYQRVVKVLRQEMRVEIAIGSLPQPVLFVSQIVDEGALDVACHGLELYLGKIPLRIFSSQWVTLRAG